MVNTAQQIGGSVGPNWTSIVEPAGDSETTWLAERDTAVPQAAYWDAMLQQARDGEARVQNSH
ncbi:hypothetical protein [Amycolatopsis pigmentata]|uniref:Uncharacterized protein n=1 Tax=Amycolatopsis pigmentata TaxID=450801 RepID=A0ABW5FIE1_9PSEU